MTANEGDILQRLRRYIIHSPADSINTSHGHISIRLKDGLYEALRRKYRTEYYRPHCNEAIIELSRSISVACTYSNASTNQVYLIKNIDLKNEFVIFNKLINLNNPDINIIIDKIDNKDAEYLIEYTGNTIFKIKIENNFLYTNKIRLKTHRIIRVGTYKYELPNLSLLFNKMISLLKKDKALRGRTTASVRLGVTRLGKYYLPYLSILIEKQDGKNIVVGFYPNIDYLYRLRYNCKEKLSLDENDICRLITEFIAPQFENDATSGFTFIEVKRGLLNRAKYTIVKRILKSQSSTDTNLDILYLKTLLALKGLHEPALGIPRSAARLAYKINEFVLSMHLEELPDNLYKEFLVNIECGVTANGRPYFRLREPELFWITGREGERRGIRRLYAFICRACLRLSVADINIPPSKDCILDLVNNFKEIMDPNSPYPSASEAGKLCEIYISKLYRAADNVAEYFRLLRDNREEIASFCLNLADTLVNFSELTESGLRPPFGPANGCRLRID